jgi:protocatechuate 3,4-dioxygenase beta subunit
LSRRRLVGTVVAGSGAWLAAPAVAAARRAVRAMTEGPFYPPARWRSRWSDWDADLTRITQGAQTRIARGEHMGLELVVIDTDGRAVDGCEVEIWQCDALQQYRHPSVPLDAADRAGDGTPRHDAGFQGFGSAVADARGALSFRTIRPVPYPGRTPHIHFKLRHVTFGEFTSQLFVAGDPGNAADGLWRRLAAADREGLEMRLVRASASVPAAAGAVAGAAAAAAGAMPPLAWAVRHELVVPA